MNDDKDWAKIIHFIRVWNFLRISRKFSSNNRKYFLDTL